MVHMLVPYCLSGLQRSGGGGLYAHKSMVRLGDNAKVAGNYANVAGGLEVVDSTVQLDGNASVMGNTAQVPCFFAVLVTRLSLLECAFLDSRPRACTLLGYRDAEAGSWLGTNRRWTSEGMRAWLATQQHQETEGVSTLGLPLRWCYGAMPASATTRLWCQIWSCVILSWSCVMIHHIFSHSHSVSTLS